MYRRRRLLPLVLLAGAAGITGLVLGATHTDGRIAVAERYLKAWQRGDYTAMYKDLSDDARTRVSAAAFAQIHRTALEMATASAVVPGQVTIKDDRATAPVAVRTRIFGTVRAPIVLPMSGDGDQAGIDWRANLTFPGVPAGTTLGRTTTMPPRATILARDGSVLAKGADRTPASDMSDVAINTVGQMGPIPEDRKAQLRALGVPADTKVGLSGLERALDVKLLGLPGGELRAGAKVLARARPRQARAVRSTVSPALERTAVTALANRLGGVVALDPGTGEILAFAGIAFSGLQPPGSTFKMITVSGALQHGAAKLSDTFPVQTEATLSGVALSNANGEACGGSLANSFAESCNSVFAPMGVKLGTQKLVETAEAYGFNSKPDIGGAATSTIPGPNDIGDDLAVGSTSIGQGQVQATTLQMATVAATIGRRGVKPHLTLDLAAARQGLGKGTRVVSGRTARLTEKLMLGVTRYGTGVAAAIPGVKVAGKTGTAELENTQECDVSDDPEASDEDCSSGSDPSKTDAWFAAYAPAGNGTPKVAVCVMLVRNGAGGDTAAPVAREVIAAALKR